MGTFARWLPIVTRPMHYCQEAAISSIASVVFTNSIMAGPAWIWHDDKRITKTSQRLADEFPAVEPSDDGSPDELESGLESGQEQAESGAAAAQ